jgi:glucokinase
MEQSRPAAPLYLGVDLGGTNIRAGVVDDTGRVLSRTSLATEAEKGPDHGIARICAAARQAVLSAEVTLSDIRAIGVGSPGPMDLKAQIIIDPHNLPGWLNLPLARRVGANLGLAAVLQNDANAAALGEYWVGAGKGTNSLVQLTLGTGIGCGIVIDGKILEGEHSHGGEAGHQRIALERPRLNTTGLYGSLEAYASATAVVERTREALEAGEPSQLADKIAAGEKLTCELVFLSADAGDKLAERMVDETAFYLGIGAANLMNIIDPDIVVFSGGMIAAGEPFLNRIRKYARENALPVPRAKIELVYAKLGDNAGIIGAAACARAKFGSNG